MEKEKMKAQSMKNLLNLERKQGEKPICRGWNCLQGMKNFRNLARKTEKKIGCWLIDWLIENRDKRLLEALN